MTESRNQGITDRLKTVYPPKTSFCGGYKKSFDLSRMYSLLLGCSQKEVTCIHVISLYCEVLLKIVGQFILFIFKRTVHLGTCYHSLPLTGHEKVDHITVGLNLMNVKAILKKCGLKHLKWLI